MTRVIVTGAAGFLGNRIADGLSADASVSVIRFTRSPSAGAGTNCKLHSVELTDEPRLRRLLARLGPDVIVHAAGRTTGNAEELFRDNAAATVSLCNALVDTGLTTRLIVLGSAAELGRTAGDVRLSEKASCSPESVYGFSKLAATNYVLMCAAKRRLDATALRVFNLVSEQNSSNQVLGSFIEKAIARYSDKAPRVVTVGRLDAIRDFVVVNDLVELISKLVVSSTNERLINVCSGIGHRVRDLLQHVNAVSGNRFIIEETGPAPSPGHIDSVVGDATLLHRILGRPPRDVREELCVAWMHAELKCKR